jgi:predicted ATPase
MITGITIKNFKAIKAIGRVLQLQRFHVLIGPNASGKSTFLEAIDFVKDCLESGPRKAVEHRVPAFRDMTFMRQGGTIEIEFWLDIGYLLPAQANNVIHYRVAIREDEKLGVCVDDESLKQYAKSWFPTGKPFEVSEKVKPKRLLGKTSKGTDYYTREVGKYQDSFNFGLEKLTLSATPPDLERYPTANSVRRFLMQSTRYIQLNSRAMREPCPATRPTELELDGTNLARVVGRLHGACNNSDKQKGSVHYPETLQRWTDHLRYALPGIKEIGWSKREPDNAEFIVLKYENGLECPSWLLSDGTLRMLALTLLAFLPPSPGIYMVEEPENGVHPKGLEIILRSLSTIPESQMLLATHSPLVVQQIGKEPLLCFSYDSNGTQIYTAEQHPALAEWDGTPDLATIFAMGILG